MQPCIRNMPSLLSIAAAMVPAALARPRLGIVLPEGERAEGERADASAEAALSFDAILPRLDAPRPELRFASGRSRGRDTMRALFGVDHRAHSAAGLATNAAALYSGLVHYALQAGTEEFLARYLGSALSRRFVPVDDNRFILTARRHFLYSIELYAAALGLDVLFEGTERIPAEGPVVYIAANHASIFPDFLFAWADPAALPVADAVNFSYNLGARLFGAALFFDLLGLPLVSRAKAPGGERDQAAMTGNDALGARLFELVSRHGVRPIFFAQGGRVPTAYDDGGEQARAGFYASSPDPRRPDVYFQPGGALIAASRIANEANMPVSLIALSMQGNERVMPKNRARKFPFFGATRMNQRLTYRVVDVMSVEPGERKLSAIAGRAREAIRRDLKIDEFLEEVVGRWALAAERPAAAEAFRKAAMLDERLFVIADRIRCIHPGLEQRALFTEALLDILELRDRSGRVPPSAISPLLAHVTAAVKRFEYSAP